LFQNYQIFAKTGFLAITFQLQPQTPDVQSKALNIWITVYFQTKTATKLALGGGAQETLACAKKT